MPTYLNIIWPYIDYKTGPIFKTGILRSYVERYQLRICLIT